MEHQVLISLNVIVRGLTMQELDQKRHLLRLWVAPTDDRPLPDKYKEILGGTVEPGLRGGIIVKGTDLRITAEAD